MMASMTMSALAIASISVLVRMDDRVLLVDGQPSFIHSALQIRGDRAHGALENRLFDVDERDLESRGRCGVRDAVAHRAGADDGDIFHRPANPSRCPTREWRVRSTAEMISIPLDTV